MQTIPLTPEQRNWLKTNTYLPVIFLGVTLLIMGSIFACLFVEFAGNPIFIGFSILAGLIVLAVITATVLHIYNNTMDLKAGGAQVRIAKLIRKHETSRAPRTFYAEFEEIGTVIIMYEIYEKLQDGNMYRVVYSPHTKKGWSIE
jgi:hypothetical protein